VRAHWYWPFMRPEEMDWAVHTARVGDSILLEVLDREAAPAAGRYGRVTVLRDLPDVDRSVTTGPRWLASRAATYRTRAAVRRRHWQADRFDLVHLHYVNRFTDAFTALPHPLVLSVHDVLPHAPRIAAVERALLHRLYHRADALVVHHARLADEITQRFAVPSRMLHVVPHQVFPIDAVPAAPTDEPPMLLFFGTLRANKGLEVLAASLPDLPDDIRVVIAGHGDAPVEALARRMARDDRRVRVELGFITLERKRALFAAASVVLLPYTAFSSQSGVLHDAYGHARPVVVTDVGALGSTVREDGTGVVVIPGDPRALARGIDEVLRPGRWTACAAAAQQVAHERTPVRLGAQLRAVYDEILRGTPRG
jgi:glycosyltransferase involved in cell wall biosynthesis